MAMEKRIPRIPKPTAIPTAVELTLLPGDTEVTRPQPQVNRLSKNAILNILKLLKS